MVPKAFPKPFQEVPRQGHGKKIGPTLTACGLKFDINLICMWAYEDWVSALQISSDGIILANQ